MDMEVKRGPLSFYIGDEEHPLAQIVFVETPSKVIIEHTEVDPSLSGRGIGHSLVLKVANIAREQQKRLLSYCPFATRVLARDPALAELMKKQTV